MANNFRLENWKVESIVEEIIKNHKDDAKVWNVEIPNDESDCLVISLQGDIYLPMVNDIARAYGDDYLMISHGHGEIINLYIIPKKDPGYTLGGKSLSAGDDDDTDEQEESKAPAIPDDMRHKKQFYESKDIIIPGTEVKRSRTEENEQVVAWIKETGHYPIVYIRLEDGVHVEVSNIYDQRARDLLERGEAVGGDGRKYKIEDPDNIFPVGSSICVRATCIETGRSDAYGLDFFV